MSPPKILDSHIHLWPSTATSELDHAWMKPGFILTKRHGIQEYDAATATAAAQPAGFVYVETDRYLQFPTPRAIPPTAHPEDHALQLKIWAHAPLNECAFLRRIVTGAVQSGDGARSEDGQRLKGLVIWAPFHLPRQLFDMYLALAREKLGDAALRIVGYRFLLQGRKAEDVVQLLADGVFAANVRRACADGVRAAAFDIGVDAHRDGVGALEAAEKLVEDVGEGVKFVLNHLCKPDLGDDTWDGSERWRAATSRLSQHPNVYVKVSGALNEFAPGATPASTAGVLEKARPYLDHMLHEFGAQRLLFGSDWPVCNVGGPKGEQGNWGFWVEVVQAWMEEKKLSEEEREWIWAKSAVEAYGIEGF